MSYEEASPLFSKKIINRYTNSGGKNPTSPGVLFSYRNGMPGCRGNEKDAPLTEQVHDYFTAINERILKVAELYLYGGSYNIDQINQIVDKINELSWQHGIVPAFFEDAGDLEIIQLMGIAEQRINLVNEYSRQKEADKYYVDVDERVRIPAELFCSEYRRQDYMIMMMLMNDDARYGTYSATVTRWLETEYPEISIETTDAISEKAHKVEQQYRDQGLPFFNKLDWHQMAMLSATTDECRASMVSNVNDDQFTEAEIPSSVQSQIQAVFDYFISRHDLDPKIAHSLAVRMSTLSDTQFAAMHQSNAYYSPGLISLRNMRHVAAKDTLSIEHELSHAHTRSDLFTHYSFIEFIASTLPDGHCAYPAEILMFHYVHSIIDRQNKRSLPSSELYTFALLRNDINKEETSDRAHRYITTMLDTLGLSDFARVMTALPDNYLHARPELLQYIEPTTIEVLLTLSQKKVETSIDILDQIVQNDLDCSGHVTQPWTDEIYDMIRVINPDRLKRLIQSFSACIVTSDKSLPSEIPKKLGILLDIDLERRGHQKLHLSEGMMLQNGMQIVIEPIIHRYAWYCRQKPEDLYVKSSSIEPVRNDELVRIAPVTYRDMSYLLYNLRNQLAHSSDKEAAYNNFIAYLRLAYHHKLVLYNEANLPVTYLEMSDDEKRQYYEDTNHDTIRMMITLDNALTQKYPDDYTQVISHVERIITGLENNLANAHILILYEAFGIGTQEPEGHPEITTATESEFLPLPYQAKMNVINSMTTLVKHADCTYSQALNMLSGQSFSQVFTDDERRVISYLQNVSTWQEINSPEHLAFVLGETYYVMNDNLQLVSDYLKNYFTNAINSHLSQFLDSTSHSYQKPNPHAHFVPHAFVLYLSDGKVTTSLYTPAIEHKDKHTIIKIMFNPDMREEFYTLPNLAIQTNRQVIDINYLLTIYHYISSIQLSLLRLSESLHIGHEDTQEMLEMLIYEDMYPPFLHRIFQRVGIPVTRDESEDAWVFPVRDIVSETALAEVRTFILNTYGEEELILFNELLSLGTDIQTTH